MLTELYQALSYYLLATWIGYCGIALTQTPFKKHPLLAISLGRITGLLLWAYLYWLLRCIGWLSHTTTAWWTYTLLYTTALTLPLILNDPTRQWLSQNKKSLLKLETIGITLFIIGCTLRALHPAILPSGGEKFMELTLLQSIIHSTNYPPQDLWLADQPISYYYLGYLLFGGLMKGLSLPPTIGINLAVPLILSLCVTALTALIHTLIRPVITSRHTAATYATLATLTILLAGSQSGLTHQTQNENPNWWWNATRIIQDHSPQGQPQTIITEFPAFTFLHGDLHPHLMGLPNILLALSLLLIGLKHRPHLLLSATCLGFAIFTNTWDAPLILALLLAPTLLRLKKTPPLHSLLQLLTIPALALLIAAPFLNHFHSQASGILHNLQNFTPLKPTLTLFAPPILLALYAAWKNKHHALAPHFPLTAAAALSTPWIIKFIHARATQHDTRYAWNSACHIATSGGALLYWLSTLTFATLLIQHSKKQTTPEKNSLIIIGLLASGLLLAPEHLYLSDLFQTRMNTLFKTYFQATLLLGLLTWAALPYLIPPHSKNRALKITLLLLPALTGSLYTIKTTNTLRAQHPTYSLNGQTWLKENHPQDHQIIQWIKQHSPPNTLLLEATGHAYTHAGRIATFTGRPTHLAWPGHQHQWRGQTAYQQTIAPRKNHIQYLYQHADKKTWHAYLTQHHITHIILGTTEIINYQLTAPRIQQLDSYFKTQPFGNSRIYQAP